MRERYKKSVNLERGRPRCYAKSPIGHNVASGLIGYMTDQTVRSMSDNGQATGLHDRPDCTLNVRQWADDWTT